MIVHAATLSHTCISYSGILKLAYRVVRCLPGDCDKERSSINDNNRHRIDPNACKHATTVGTNSRASCNQHSSINDNTRHRIDPIVCKLAITDGTNSMARCNRHRIAPLAQSAYVTHYAYVGLAPSAMCPWQPIFLFFGTRTHGVERSAGHRDPT